MTRYHFVAVNDKGETYSGELEASSTEAAAAVLLEQGHVPVRVKPSGGLLHGLLGSLETIRDTLPVNQTALMTRNLAVMLRAGIPLDHALEMCASIFQNEPLNTILVKAAKSVRDGQPLYRALEPYRNAIGNLTIGLIRAGEESNQLPAALSRISEYLEHTHKVRERIKSALIYPAIVTAIAVLSVVFLIAIVVPRFKPLFANAEDAMPLSLKVLSFVGEGAQSYGGVFVVLLVAAYFALRHLLARPEYRRKRDAFLLSVPVLGSVIVKSEAANYAKTLSILLENGKPLPAALEIAAAVVNNRVIAEVTDQAAHSIAHSGKLSPLLTGGAIPPLLSQMVQVGEETNKLPPLLNQSADILENDVQRATERLLSLLAPALTIFLGFLVGAIILTVMSAVFSLNDLAF